MARPFASTFEKERASPLNQAPATLSAPSASSYKTNVNRQKTRKWVEAKAVDYGGDDWGEDDDYYDEPPPPLPPVSKPTGLRQKGQGLQNPMSVESPIASAGKKTYGDLPAVPPIETSTAAHHRANSFDEGDEKRSFSSGTPLQSVPQSAGPATRFSQIVGGPPQRVFTGPPALSLSTQQPSYPTQSSAQGLRNQVTSPTGTAGSPHPSIPHPGTSDGGIMSPVSTTTQSSVDYQARKDYSPSASIPPLNTRMSPPPVAMRGSPASQVANTDSPGGARFPMRKSSLSQSDIPDIVKQRQETELSKPWTGGPPRSSPSNVSHSPLQNAGAPKVWMAAQPSSPGGASRSPGGPAKAQAFVRPSDIYRRVEEERDKGRQSLESGRPGMDSILDTKASDSSASPATPVLREPTAPDNSGYGARRIPSLEVDDSSHRLQPFLEPVKERKSEYGFDGVDINSQISKGQGSNSALGPLNTGLTSSIDPIGMRRQSVSPKLPDLKLSTSASAPGGTSTSTISASLGGQDTADLALWKEPSLGFASAVHQTFDGTSDTSSIPISPASRSGSAYRKSDTDSTNGVSPIMSRVSSMAVSETRNRETIPPSIPEGVEERVSQPKTAPEQTITGNVEDKVVDVGTHSTTDFEPGHQRDISVPSPGNSPAKITNVFNPEVSLESHQAHDSVSEISRKTTPVSEVSRIRESPALTPTANVQSQVSLENLRDAIAPEIVPPVHSPTRSPAPLLPTPDPAMAPSGDIYSQPVDPRVTSGVHDVSANDQSPPVGISRDSSSDSSSTVPLPPPKDVSVDEAKDIRQSSLSTSTHSSTKNLVEPSGKIHTAPVSDADTPSRAEENDRLQSEIVQSLGGPEPLDTVRRHNSYLYDDSTPSGQARESTYLPSEYDNYWATAAEDEKPIPQLPSPTRNPVEVPQPPVQGRSLSVKQPESPSVPPPLEVRKSVVLESLPQESSLQRRFSWERSFEDVSKLPPLGTEFQSSTDKSVDMSSAAGPPPQNTQVTSPQTRFEVSSQPMSITEDANSKYHPDVTPAEGRSPSESKPPSDLNSGHGAEILSGATILSASTVSTFDQGVERRLSLADMKDMISMHSTEPPEDQHPALSPHPSNQLQSPNPVSPSMVLPQPVKIVPFKDITFMTSPHQRIQTYEQTRQQFAAMETGLTNWVTIIKSLHPEHASATGSWTGTGGNRYLQPASVPQQGLQQPYYQQYLNASSPAQLPTNPARLSGSNTPLNISQTPQSHHSFSPSSSGKLTSHEVQAKGKELLHAAGVFGGKAGKAGKGLLAKGKSRFRSSASGDKINSSPTPTQQPSRPHQAEQESSPVSASKSKASRRSWALLSKSLSSKPHGDGLTQQSRETTPLPEPEFARQRSTSMDSTTSRSSFLPPVGLFGRRRRASSSLSREVSATPQAQAQTHGALGSSALSREVLAQGSNDNNNEAPIPRSSQPKAALVVETQPKNEEPMERQSDIGVPAPIAKNPPSFDPYNATPITEEDVFSQSRPISRIPDDFEKDQTSQDAEAAPINEEPQHPVSPTSPVSSDDANNDDIVSIDSQIVSGEQQQQSKEAGNEANEDWAMVDGKEGLEEPPSVPTPPSPVSPMPTPPPASNTDVGMDADEKLPAAKGHSRARSSVSIMDRPRGAYFEDIEESSFSTPAQSTPVLENALTSSSTTPATVNVTNHQVSSPSNPPYQQSSWNKGMDSTPNNIQKPQSEPQATRKSSFKGLPPIRRSTPFGFELDAVDDKEDVPNAQRPVNRQKESIPQHNQEEVRSAGPSQQPVEPSQTHTNGPGPSQVTSPGSLTSRPPPSFVPFNNTLPQSNISPNILFSGGRWSETAARWNEPRPPHIRSPSGPLQGSTPPTSSPLSDRGKRGASMPLQTRPFEQPPSSAERYPELFRQGTNQEQQAPPSDEMPAHYYQAPISPADAYLPRQTNEYQLSGVGPPTEDPRFSGPKRNSGFFREIGSRIRTASRERTRSRSRSRGEAAFSPPTPPAQPNGNEYADSVDSGDMQEGKKPQSGLFGSMNLTRLSTPTGSGPPRSRESIAGHHPGSISNMLSTPSPTIQTKGESGRLRSLFKREETNSSQQSRPKPSKLNRASTGGSGLLDDGKKKTRFSSLGGVFGKSSRQSWKGSASEGAQSVAGDLPSIERRNSMPLQAAALSRSSRQNTPPQGQAKAHNQAPASLTAQTVNTGSISQKRGLLSKIQGGNSGAPESQPHQSTRTRQSSRTRHPSSAGLLGGLLGRRSNQIERDNEPAIVPQQQQQALQPQQPQPPHSPQIQIPPQQPPQQPPFQQAHPSRRSQESYGRRISQPQFFDPRMPLQTPRPQDIYPPSQLNGAQMQSLNPHHSQRSFQSHPSHRSHQSHQSHQSQKSQKSQMYGDPRMQLGRRGSMQNMVHQNEREIPWQDLSDPQLERGRQQMSEPVPEPVYERVPIPGGYSLVHSQGSMMVPSAYDPHPANYYAPQQHMNSPYQYDQPPSRAPHQQLPGNIPHNQFQGYGSPQPQQPLPHDDPRAYRSSQKPLSLEPIDPNLVRTRRSNRPLSREDLLARSPAREAEGQQRPYQLTLPDGADDDDSDEELEVRRAAANQQHSNSTSRSVSRQNLLRSPPPLQPLGIPAQVPNLTQPTIRHPESPAGYPLPDSTFSPVNPSAANLPLPPLPVAPQTQQMPSSVPMRNPAVQRVSGNSLQPKSDLDRSDTGRTTTSGVSGVSGVSNLSHDPFDRAEQEDYLALPSEKDLERGLSPSPPTVHLTPDRGVSPDTGSDGLTTTQVNRPLSSNSDLYNATPRDTKPPEYTIEDESRGRAEAITAAARQQQLNRRRSHEEKIPVNSTGQEEENRGSRSRSGGRLRADEDDVPVTMSATSYPGQEWNPFMNGYDDGLE